MKCLTYLCRWLLTPETNCVSCNQSSGFWVTCASVGSAAYCMSFAFPFIPCPLPHASPSSSPPLFFPLPFSQRLVCSWQRYPRCLVCVTSYACLQAPYQRSTLYCLHDSYSLQVQNCLVHHNTSSISDPLEANVKLAQCRWCLSCV